MCRRKEEQHQAAEMRAVCRKTQEESHVEVVTHRIHIWLGWAVRQQRGLTKKETHILLLLCTRLDKIAAFY